MLFFELFLVMTVDAADVMVSDLYVRGKSANLNKISIFFFSIISMIATAADKFGTYH